MMPRYASNRNATPSMLMLIICEYETLSNGDTGGRAPGRNGFLISCSRSLSPSHAVRISLLDARVNFSGVAAVSSACSCDMVHKFCAY